MQQVADITAAGRSTQAAVLTTGMALSAVTLLAAAHDSLRMGLLFLIGAALGATLLWTVFGFGSAYRNLLTRNGDTSGARAQLLMLALATLLFAPVLAAGSIFGNPVGGAAAPVSLGVAAGAFLFGIGMQLAGGCASGTLFTVGGGSLRMVCTLVAFCAGTLLSSVHFGWWAALPGLGVVKLPDMLGWTGGTLLQLAVLATLWIVLARRSAPSAGRTSPETAQRQRLWLTGAVALAVLNFAVLATAGHPWGITWGYTLWAGKTAAALGWDASAYPFWQGGTGIALARSVFGDVTAVMNFGILLGACMAAAATGRFSFQWRYPPRAWVSALIGGLLMGYGSRIAYGCNVGAFFSGVASQSLHGWLWVAAALPGCAVGIRLNRRFRL
jgi:hypothetical protein